jgi:hypothetical protein
MELGFLRKYAKKNRSINMVKINIGSRCVECNEDTSFGSGRFVNRIPASVDTTCGDKEYEIEGYLCPECNQLECDRCDNLIGVDEDITPWSLGLEEDEFEDGAYRVHSECLTSKEKMIGEKNNG